jgi:hypothetical protein
MDHKQLLAEGWVLAGHIGVDSGQAMICDPCYVLRDEDDDRPPETTYGEVCAVNINPKGYPCYGPVPFRMGHEGCAVNCSAGFGDGFYPVYVKIQNFDAWGDRVVAMMVDFDSVDFGEAWEEE